MNLKPELDHIRELSAAIIANQREAEMEAKEPISMAFALDRLKHWKQWYLRKNQPKNHFRITRIIPPGMDEQRHFYIQKLQVFGKKGLIDQEVIDTDTYDFISQLQDWIEVSNGRMDCFYYVNPNFIS